MSKIFLVKIIIISFYQDITAFIDFTDIKCYMGNPALSEIVAF